MPMMTSLVDVISLMGNKLSYSMDQTTSTFSFFVICFFFLINNVPFSCHLIFFQSIRFSSVPQLCIAAESILVVDPFHSLPLNGNLLQTQP